MCYWDIYPARNFVIFYNSVLKAVYSAGEPDLLTRTRVLVFGSQLQILINISLHLHVYATLRVSEPKHTLAAT